MGDGGIFAHPHGVGLSVIPFDPPFIEAVDDDAILDVGVVADVEGEAFVGPDGSPGGDEDVSPDADVPDNI
jgi:hypothetical protein